MVEEPSEEESIQIILGLKEKLELHHGIEITDEAIIAAVQYSTKYMTDRFLPDKAIDLIDEAAAGLKLSADSMPPEIQEMETLIRSKKILLKSLYFRKRNTEKWNQKNRKTRMAKKKYPS